MAAATLHLIAWLVCNLVMHVGILRLHCMQVHAHTHKYTTLAQLFAKPPFMLFLLPPTPVSPCSAESLSRPCTLSHSNIKPALAEQTYRGTNRWSLPPNTVFLTISSQYRSQDVCLKRVYSWKTTPTVLALHSYNIVEEKRIKINAAEQEILSFSFQTRAATKKYII